MRHKSDTNLLQLFPVASRAAAARTMVDAGTVVESGCRMGSSKSGKLLSILLRMSVEPAVVGGGLSKIFGFAISAG